MKKVQYGILDEISYGKASKATFHGAWWFKKVPLFVVIEYEPSRNGYTGKAFEFFTKLPLNAPSDEYGLRDGLWYGNPYECRDCSAQEFESRISMLSEWDKKAIAKQVRKYIDLAHEYYQAERERVIRINCAEQNAADRLKNHKAY